MKPKIDEYFVNPIRAYRMWKIIGVYKPTRETVRLTSFFNAILRPPIIYPPASEGGAVACCFCEQLCDTAPGPPSPTYKNLNPSGCGIYAVKNPFDILSEHLLRSNDCRSINAIVVGSVLLGGIIYEHEIGYRAQYAVVESLFDTGIFALKELAEEYQVPIISGNQLQSRYNGLERYRMGQ